MRAQQLKSKFDKLEAELKRTKSYEKNPSDYPDDFPAIRDKSVVKREFEGAKKELDTAITHTKREIDEVKKYLNKNESYYRAGSMSDEHAKAYGRYEKRLNELNNEMSILKGKGEIPGFKKESMIGTHRKNVDERVSQQERGRKLR